ncbi:arsenite efflux transporter metallochaperone ArsD [Clostridium sporogenes]|uniref:arsenite efflux transporter metallochaperone ArsD n=1 Tax=Clostridium sporogenes TaxID=1509 RepID=UPI0003020070|nr:arsenite efflux transporter metallochaperone ArsD [Clostridium sporogenes]MCW6094859.1 arsenite efflux transporter metallochaperone ArsD [Clostridium sporogenes]NFE67063.1 arsenite efflux transporter metallochaperone ArsD [Clostridium sporogenes]NFG95548.1 arsenite efflux transporter metallochaperone ArsD [Clostridium sporogenes]NFH31557.1 arsenite efflux transporter metallochaperone ArsD [Clostridium sporogenes]NFL18963.1 arsenite efflux transporter metallochaperone ArsD [Clostridium sporo
MKKMIIFDPAMCCSTGVCGPSVDPELLRVATTINRLKNNGILVERYNLTSNPQIFVDNKEINQILNKEGVEILPVTMVDGIIVKTKVYPTNKEFCELLDIPEDSLKITIKKPSKGCNCKGGCC